MCSTARETVHEFFIYLFFWCCVQFTFNSILVAACARCLQGKRGERVGGVEIDGER